MGSIIAAGIIPAGMEMMDQAAANAAEDFCSCGYPRTAEALLIVELDGAPTEIDCLIKDTKAIAKTHDATSIKVSKDEAERLRFWAGRKAAFPAVGPDDTRLLLHGWYHSSSRFAGYIGVYAGIIETIWLACRQCFSCRRW